MSRPVRKQLRQFLAAFPEWEIERTRGDHVKLTYKTGQVVTTSATTSDHRSYLNLRALLKRIEKAA